MSRSAVIVQARMGSSRLPGKVLKMLQGKTFLEHCLDRCRKIEGIDEVICATVDTPECDVIVDLCRKRDYRWSRGSEMNAVNRYRNAAREAKVDHVMRITSDCPLADPQIAGDVAKLYQAGGYDLVTTNIPPTWPIGLDVEMFSFEALEQADREATIASDREHVSTFIRARPIRYRLQSIHCPLEGRAHWRLTLDTEADRQFFVALAERIDIDIADVGWREFITFVDAHPDLLAINTLS